MARINIAIVADSLDPLDTATHFILGAARALPNVTIYTADGSSIDNVTSLSTGWHKLPKIFRNRWFKKHRFASIDLSNHDIVITTSPLSGFVTLSPRQLHLHYMTLSDLNIAADKLREKFANTIDYYLADCQVTADAIKLIGSSPTILTPPVVTKHYRPERQRETYFVALTNLKVDLPHLGINIRYVDSSDSQRLHQLLASAWGYIALPDRFDPLILPALASGSLVVAPELLGDIIQPGESGALYKNLPDIGRAITECANITAFPSSLQRKARRYDQTLFTTKLKKTLVDTYKSKR